MRLALVLTAVTGLLGGCKGDFVKCDQACRNYARLAYWKRADARLAEFPADRRDAERKALLAKFDHDLEAGIDQCVSQCQSANNAELVECWIDAKTADQVDNCSK
jgi:hypothetical protein